MQRNKMAKRTSIAISILLTLLVLFVYHDALLECAENAFMQPQNSLPKDSFDNKEIQYNLQVEGIFESMDSFEINNKNTEKLSAVLNLAKRSKRMLDPLQYAKHTSTDNNQASNFQALYAKLRNKRAKMELNILENEYVRCRKSLDENDTTNNDCILAFLKLYNTAKKFIDEMDQMNLQLKNQNNTQVVDNSKSEVPLDQTLSFTEPLITTKMPTADGTQESQKPVKISWILDGSEQDKNMGSETTTVHSVISTVPIVKVMPISWILDGPAHDKDNSNESIQRDSSQNITTETESSLSESTPCISTFDFETDNSDDIIASSTELAAETVVYSKKVSIPPLHSSTAGLVNKVTAEPKDKNEKERLHGDLINIQNANSWKNIVANFGIKSEPDYKEENSTIVVKENKFALELIDSYGSLNNQDFKAAGPKLNPVNIQGKEDSQFMTFCDYMAAQRLRNKNFKTDSVHESRAQNHSEFVFTQPPKGVQFTSRAPMGFPVTGETMKASAQFMFNPNFGTPTIPLCFFVTPANMRFMQQTPMWTPSYGSVSPNMFNFMGGGATIPAVPANQGFQMGSGGSSAVFMVPPSFGSTGGNSQFMSGSAGGTQGNIANMANMAIFNKNVTPLKSQSQQQQQQQQQSTQPQQNQAQPRQLFCTYMPNQDSKKFVDQTSSSTGNGGFPTQGFVQLNTKLREKVKKPTSGTDIIYTSFMEPLDRTDNNKFNSAAFECVLPEQTACESHNECIGSEKWCDSIVDCSDGSDETSCTCRDRLLNGRVCDGYADCPMGEDEIGCFGCDEFMYSCYENLAEYEFKNRSHVGMCYNRLEKCDGFNNCLNGRDEMECNLIISQSDIINTHVISSSAGFLYHNYRGEWYPVCNKAQNWAEEACANEYISEDGVTVSHRELLAKGPFIEQNGRSGTLFFPNTCKRHNENNKLTDQMVHVSCNIPKCGVRRKYVLALPIKRHKRSVKEHRTRRQAMLLGNGRIVGGSQSKPHEWPFAVALYKDGQFHCGATIYNERWIISAAHCVVNHHRYYYEAYAGYMRRRSYASYTQIRIVSDIVVHHTYQRSNMRNDLALLRLVEPFEFNRWVKPICLPSRGRTMTTEDWIWGPREKTLCTVVGWGAIWEKGPESEQLRQVSLPIRPFCNSSSLVMDKHAICAGDVGGGRDACQGDSGGPLFCRSVLNEQEFYLAGVVSHGHGCARQGEYGVYTRVALYLDWIANITSLDVFALPNFKPKTICPGYRCMWGIKRCIPANKRCDRIVHCLGAEDEIGCSYNNINHLLSVHNTTFESTSTVINDSTIDDIRKLLNDRKMATATPISDENVKELFEINLETNSKSRIDNDRNISHLTIDSNETTTPAAPVLTTILTTASDLKSLQFRSTSSLPNVVTTTQPSTILKRSTNVPAFNTSPLPFSVEMLTKIEEMSNDDSSSSSEESTEKIVATTANKMLGDSALRFPKKFICRKIPQIIELVNRCDRLPDCEDGTDELNCNCRDYMKGASSSLICDGKVDCNDFTDEADCGNCGTKEFYCSQSKKCVPRKKRCDQRPDCFYEEDEQDCFALSNGEEIALDVDIRPLLNSAGILSHNEQGIWRLLCLPVSAQKATAQKLAQHACSAIGFDGYNHYNTSVLGKRPKHVLPLNPATMSGLIKLSSESLEYSSEDFLSKPSKILLAEQKSSEGKTCTTLFVACKEYSKAASPVKVLRIGTEIQSRTTSVSISTLSHDYKLHEAVEDVHWPWLTQIYHNGELFCLGILLNRHWILTHASCYQNISSGEFLTGLFGGSKMQSTLHHSLNEQVRRLDFSQAIPNENLLFYHMEQPVNLTRYVLPIALGYRNGSIGLNASCIALVRDSNTGNMLSLDIKRQNDEKICPNESQQLCYHFVDDQEYLINNLPQFSLQNCDKTDAQSEVKTDCNLGILACKFENNLDHWRPVTIFNYNNSNFQDIFPLSMLNETNHKIIDKIINNSSHLEVQPTAVCSTHRCSLGACLDKEQICNGVFDCHDGTDEDPILCAKLKQDCLPSEFKCRNSTTCVPKTKFCDHVLDCEDLTDEPTICSCYTYLRATDPKKICNGIRNCLDKSDESPALCNCTENHFSCKTGECLSQDFVCDGEPDCPDSEDEKYCLSLQAPLKIISKSQIGIDGKTPYKLPPADVGLLIEQSYGVWHTKCFDRSAMPPTLLEVRQMCKRLGYKTFRKPRYRLIDDNDIVFHDENDTLNMHEHARSAFGVDEIPDKYGIPLKVVIASKFSPLNLNEQLSVFIKPSRYIAQLVSLNVTESQNCLRLELKC